MQYNNKNKRYFRAQLKEIMPKNTKIYAICKNITETHVAYILYVYYDGQPVYITQRVRILLTLPEDDSSQGILVRKTGKYDELPDIFTRLHRILYPFSIRQRRSFTIEYL